MLRSKRLRRKKSLNSIGDTNSQAKEANNSSLSHPSKNSDVASGFNTVQLIPSQLFTPSRVKESKEKVLPGEKRFECSVCSKKFAQKSYLVVHMRRHTGEKPYTCSICGKQYRDLSTVITHVRIHTGEKPYTCSVCMRQFSDSSYYNRHIRTHTELGQ